MGGWVGSGGDIGAYWRSTFLLMKMSCVRYFMMFWCINFMRYSIVGLGVLSFFIFAIGCSCMAPLTPDIMVIRV